MVKLLLTLTLVGFSHLSICQLDERFAVNVDFAFAALPITFQGPLNQNNTLTIIDNYHVDSDPEYKWTKFFSLSGIVTSHLEFKIPVVKRENWSIGLRCGLGIGYQRERVSGIAFDFPQFIYFKSSTNKFKYSILGGVKYSISKISHRMFLLGVEYDLGDGDALQFYCTPVRARLYAAFTDGSYVPVLKYGEFGIKYTLRLTKN